jgi:hypothetical protein
VLCVLTVWAEQSLGTSGLFIKLFTLSRRITCWVDAVADSIALVLIGVVLRQQQGNLFAVDVPARLVTWVYGSLTVILLVVALFVAIDLVAKVVRLGRNRLAK